METIDKKTTIGCKTSLKKLLDERKTHPKETYEEVIRKLLGGVE